MASGVVEGKVCFELVALVKIKAVGKREWSFSVLLSVGMPCTGFARPQLSQSLMIHMLTWIHLLERPGLLKPLEKESTQFTSRMIKTSGKEHFNFFFFFFPTDCQVKKGPTIKRWWHSEPENLFCFALIHFKIDLLRHPEKLIELSMAMAYKERRHQGKQLSWAHTGEGGKEEEQGSWVWVPLAAGEHAVITEDIAQ